MEQNICDSCKSLYFPNFEYQPKQQHICFSGIQTSLIVPSRKLLERSSFSAFENDDHLYDVHDQIRNSNVILDSLATGYYKVKDKKELEKIVNAVRENIDLLEDAIDMCYKNPIQAQLDKMDISLIKKFCKDLKTGGSLLDKITLIYDEPINDVTSGRIIRSAMSALEKFQFTKDPTVFDEHIKQCEKELVEVKKQIIDCTRSNCIVDHVKELTSVQESLVTLMQIFFILINFSKAEKRRLSNIRYGSHL